MANSNNLKGKRQAKNDEKTSAGYARSLLEASLDPLVTISPEGKITDVNNATVEVTGIPREKLVGTDFSDYFTEPDKAREGYQLVFSKGIVKDYPLTIRRKDGNLTEVLYNATVYRDSSGKVAGVFAAARDITAQKKTEEELARANQTLQAEVEERRKAEKAILELSTPVLQLRENLLILPIIGILDSMRARQLTEQLLHSVRDNRAKVAVVDITGVPAVDSKVANHLLQTAEAARLMGAKVILTGLSPEVAQSLVSIGVDLGRLITVGDLQGGIIEADRLLGYKVVRSQESFAERGT